MKEAAIVVTTTHSDYCYLHLKIFFTPSLGNDVFLKPTKKIEKSVAVFPHLTQHDGIEYINDDVMLACLMLFSSVAAWQNTKWIFCCKVYENLEKNSTTSLSEILYYILFFSTALASMMSDRNNFIFYSPKLFIYKYKFQVWIGISALIVVRRQWYTCNRWLNSNAEPVIVCLLCLLAKSWPNRACQQ